MTTSHVTQVSLQLLLWEGSRQKHAWNPQNSVNVTKTSISVTQVWARYFAQYLNGKAFIHSLNHYFIHLFVPLFFYPLLYLSILHLFIPSFVQPAILTDVRLSFHPSISFTYSFTAALHRFRENKYTDQIGICTCMSSCNSFICLLLYLYLSITARNCSSSCL